MREFDENIIPIRKVDKFYLCKGKLSDSGEVIEQERVGVAYLKPTSSMFRLRLWTFPRGEYFLAREGGDHFQYLALCLDEFERSGQEKAKQWHKVGIGQVVGNFIRIKFHLLGDDIYLCLFPNESNQAAADVA